LQPRQGLAKVRAKREPGNHISCSRECRRVWGNEPSHSQMDSQIFIKQFQGSKLNGWKCSLYNWKALGTLMFEMGLHDPLEHLKHKLWPKERPGVKLAIWLPTTKYRESTQFPCVHGACDILLENSWRRLQLWFKPHLN
jgi:hypothetical protein